MEVATLFSSSSEVLSLFDSFIYSYPKIIFDGKDSDTAFFNDLKTGKRQLYYHFKLNDVPYEFSYSYSEEDQNSIRMFLNGDKIFSIDLSFSSNEFLEMLFDDFMKYLGDRHKGELVTEIVISHPHKGVFRLPG
jgi:hypothetical protein